MSTNDITGDRIASKPGTKAYGNGWDLLWGKKEQQEPAETKPTEEDDDSECG